MAQPILDVQAFLTLFDEFKKVNHAKLNILIGISSKRVNAAVWGDNAQYATALLTAHMLSCTGGQGGDGGAAGGALTSETVGDLTRSFGTIGAPGSGDQELLTTRYGAQYVELRRETFATATVI